MSDPRDEERSSEGEEHSPESDDIDDPPTDTRPADEARSPEGADGPETNDDTGSPVTDRAPVEASSGSTGGNHPTRDRTGSTGDRDRSRSGPARTRTGSGERSRRSEAVRYLFDIASSIFIVAAAGCLLFAASGVWPPLVAIESGSMEPHIQQGDLVFVMDEQRFPGPGAHGDSGVVTAHAGQQTGFQSFEGYGDVIVYQPYGSTEETPIIHRAMFWVEAGENWYDDADPEYVGTADSCGELANCPAPHSGFITKGDNTVSNRRYDQAMGISGPVRPEWVMGTAEVRVPLLGEIRLLTGQAGADANVRTNATGAAGP